ncbi:MarR family winged helix-turn-helix transcriptional regulator [Haploplasma axanthum]|uniref:MarR family transcriptional regulator n=1 Tax=Haploplasma axanthum TaxID=29552 RepID=A0A449BEX3_HAPAX|nr:MarR family transcriptional regulator [Haploplasma axanthum]VEU80987.1 MarR family transcriptional regulator [Haploplasma axanthum]
MKYDDLAKDFIDEMHNLGQMKANRKINSTFAGERFIMQLLTMKKEDITPGDISNEMNISTARVAAILNSLESKGYIRREVNQVDRRKIIVKLTDKGEKYAKKIINTIVSDVAGLLSKLGQEDATELIRLTRKISSIMEEKEVKINA